MALLVQKFGGTSVGTPDRMRAVAEHVARTVRRGDQVVVVISAMGKETDDLLRIAREVSNTRPGREMDMLITAGERKATALLCMAIADLGVEAESFTGSQAGFLTDSTHTNAKIIEVKPDRIRASLAAGRVAVVGGAQGQSAERNVTFLGRGGSDTTAVALAHALGADSCELYTDVPGVFTSDPRIVTNARKMEHITFDELLEMTANGCPKPAMRSVEYARTHGVELHVRSAFTWESGTVVTKESTMEQAIVSAVVHDADEAKVTIGGVADRPGVAAHVFRALADADVNVDLIVQNTSEQGVTDISFTVPHGDLEKAVAICETAGAEVGFTSVTAEPAIARVSVVGAGMKSHPGVAATVFETLAANDINIEMIATSAIRVSCVVAEADVERAVVALHDSFGLANGPVYVD
ncbi:MAG: aspartate kinase [Actinobacteria bacterium]|uniref:aspartate kinase n=1 Tax=freshwater metagenome TaxID=449393 RepID=A0A6J7IBF0_9ZZZZ|nr:aspartate kinase [Actinomycetota bacterium]MTA77223.1 aspartate kinase [Actinomycetota bacterium]